MELAILSHPMTSEAWCFYQRQRVTSSEAGALILQEVTPETAARWFEGEHRYTFAAMEDGVMVGLVSGVYLPEFKTGYLSYLLVEGSAGRRGIGSKLMAALEDAFAQIADCEKIDVVFRNPVHLPWFISEDGGDHHPCVPGVDMSSSLYPFLQNRGYVDFTQQNVYHQRLGDYVAPEDITEKQERLLSEGIELTLYDENRHYGLAELFDNINNPGWKAEVMANTHLPIVVAVDTHTKQEGKALVVAYTGPLTHNNGRGVFCGIGTHKSYRGRGIGKIVFCEMCRRHAEHGATFMTLYTGETNPARYIYEAAGFRITRSFANMRKIIER